MNKTLAANQDADAIGGTVNLVTKKAGDLPTLKFEGIGGFTPIVNTRYIGLVSGTVGQAIWARQDDSARCFPAATITTAAESTTSNRNPTPTIRLPVYDSMDIREYRYQRKRYGFGGSLDYKLKDPASGLYLHYFDSDFKDYGNKWVYTLNDDVSRIPPDLRRLQSLPATSLSSRPPSACRITAGSVAIGGKHVFTSSWLSWELSAATIPRMGAAGNPGATFKPVIRQPS